MVAWIIYRTSGPCKQVSHMMSSSSTGDRTNDIVSISRITMAKVGMDLFDWKRITYLIIVDYYSQFIEVEKLSRLTTEEVIRHCKSMFARHGIPEVVISDNGPQFDFGAFRKFSRDYQFNHTTSSPYYPQGNGEAERAVKTIKGLLKKGRRFIFSTSSLPINTLL